jgi:hypothetical protein
MSAEELDRIIQGYLDKGYNFFWLQDQPGEPSKATCVPNVCPVAKKSNPEQAKNIVPYVLKNRDVYTLVVRRGYNAKNELITLDTRNNEVLIKETNEPDMPIDERSAADRRNDELTIRQLKEELGQLRAEVAYLREKNAELIEDMDFMNAEAEENAQSAMADQTISTVGQVVQILPAVLDKWFSLQEQKNNLMAEQLRRSAPQRPMNESNNEQNSYHEEAGY